MSQNTAHPARGRHRHVRPMRSLHAHPRASLPPEDAKPRLAKLDAAEDETVDIDFSDRLIEHGATWRDVFRGPRDGDGEFDARTEVERFMRDHFATDELEIA